jgi:acetyl esterase/lipase
VARAIAWVHSNVADHGGDPDRLLAMGHSAGAHLVALVAADERPLKAAGKDLAILKGVIPLDTQAYDVSSVMKQNQGALLYRQVFGDDPAGWKDASPLAHVAAGKGIPPFLIFHTTGTAERGPQAQALAKALEEAGISARVVPVPKESHGQLNQTLGQPGDPETEEVMKFIESVLPKEDRGG